MPQVKLENITFSYVHVSQPKRNKQGVLKYSACVLIPKGSPAHKMALAAQEAAIKEGIAQGKFTPAMVSTLKLPLRDGDKELETEQKSGEEYKGMVFVNANANESSPPSVSKPSQGQIVPITDPTEFYSGCKGHTQLSFYPFCTEDKMSKGVAVGLNHCLKLADGQRLDGRVSADSAFADYADLEVEGDVPEETEGTGPAVLGGADPFN